MAASAGDNCVKIHDLSDLKQMHAIVTLDDERSVDSLQVCRWCELGVCRGGVEGWTVYGM